MDKNILILVLMLLLITSFVDATTIEKTVYNFGECEELYVNVSAVLNISDGEYTFPFCNETNNNYWFCECYNNYNLIMEHDVRTINNYTFVFETRIPQPRRHRSSKILYIENDTTINQSINNTLNQSINNTLNQSTNNDIDKTINTASVNFNINKSTHINNTVVTNGNKTINNTHKNLNDNIPKTIGTIIKNIGKSITDFFKGILSFFIK